MNFTGQGVFMPFISGNTALLGQRIRDISQQLISCVDRESQPGRCSNLFIPCGFIPLGTRKSNVT